MKKLNLLIAAMLLAMPAFAQGFNIEAGYTMVGGDENDISVDLGALYGQVGYEWGQRGNYTNEVEALAMIGISDDDIFGAEVTLEPSIEIAYRGTLATSSPDFSLFWRASYSRIEIEASAFGGSESADESGFGLGVGASWRGFTGGYTQYLGDLDDLSRFHIGYRFKTQ